MEPISSVQCKYKAFRKDFKFDSFCRCTFIGELFSWHDNWFWLGNFLQINRVHFLLKQKIYSKDSILLPSDLNFLGKSLIYFSVLKKKIELCSENWTIAENIKCKWKFFRQPWSQYFGLLLCFITILICHK